MPDSNPNGQDTSPVAVASELGYLRGRMLSVEDRIRGIEERIDKQLGSINAKLDKLADGDDRQNNSLMDRIERQSREAEARTAALNIRMDGFKEVMDQQKGALAAGKFMWSIFGAAVSAGVVVIFKIVQGGLVP